MTEPVTKQDLRDFSKDLKEHISSQLKPVKKEVGEHDDILRGEDKRQGLIGDVNAIKTGVRTFKWVAGVGGFAGMWTALKNYFGGP